MKAYCMMCNFNCALFELMEGIVLPMKFVRSFLCGLLTLVSFQVAAIVAIAPVSWFGDEVFFRLPESITGLDGSDNRIVSARLVKRQEAKSATSTSYRSVGSLILFPSMTALSDARIEVDVPIDGPRRALIVLSGGNRMSIDGINTSERVVDRSELSMEFKKKYEGHRLYGSPSTDGSWPMSLQINWPLVHPRKKNLVYQGVCGPTFWTFKKVDKNSNSNWSKLYVADLNRPINAQPRCRWPDPLSRIDFIKPGVFVNAEKNDFAIFGSASTVAVIDWRDGSVVRANKPIRSINEDTWLKHKATLVMLRIEPPWPIRAFEKCLDAGFPVQSTQDFWSLADACKLVALSFFYE